MNEIMEKTFELIDALEDSDLIKELDKYKRRISSNESLSKLIKEGNTTSDKYILLDIKRRLYKDSDYKNYMDSYNKLMYIVMDINSRYNKLLGKGCCK